MKKAIRLTVFAVAVVSIVCASVALFHATQALSSVSALSDVYEAPRNLATLLEQHGTASQIPMHAVTIKHLASLIAQQNRKLFVQSCVIANISVLCIILGIFALCSLWKKKQRSAQQEIAP